MTELTPKDRSIIQNSVLKERFEINFQPVVAPGERRIVSLEALCRFDPAVVAGHRLRVAQVVRHIDRAGLAAEFDLAVIGQSLAAVAKLRALAGGPLPVSVNLCPGTLASPGFVSQLKRRLLRAGVEPALLQLEISETSAADRQVYRDVIPRLVDAGIACVIDDFISGHTDFGMLTSPLIKTIKVHHTVTRSLTDSEMVRRFLRGLLMLVESTDKRLVVKGVETQDQFRFLDAIGCNKYQGYLFASPMPVAALPNFVHAFTRRPMPEIFSESHDQGSDEDLSRRHQGNHTR